MSLKAKTVLTVCTFFAVLTLAFLAVSHVVADAVVVELEKDSVRQNIERAIGALEREIATLDKFAHDWAAWDDTYTFVEDRNEEYIKKNLVDSTFQVLRLNYIVLVNSRGESVYARGYDPEAGEEIAIPSSVAEHILKRGSFSDHQEAYSGLKGLVVTPQGPVLVAARPVLKSDESGPARGTLIFGRILRDKDLKDLSEVIRLPLSLHTPGAVDLRDLEPAGFLENGEAYYTRHISQYESAGFAVLRDIHDETALILQVNAERRAARAFEAARRAFGIYLVVLMGVLSCALAVFWLDRTILSRLMKLIGDIAGTGGNSGHPQRVQVLEGRDELALLSVEINRMLDRLEEHRREIQEKEKKYRELVENAAEAIVLVQDGVVKFVNPAAARHTGYAEEELVSAPVADLVHPEDRNAVLERYRQLVEGEAALHVFLFRIITKNGDVRWMEANSVAVEWERQPATLNFLTDITERKRYEEQLKYLSLHDQLTGLYNRTFFEEELKRLSVSREYPITVLVADLDGLKLVNDTLGHAKGDEMLKACADILRASLRQSDILARIGGDEFAVLLPKTDGKTGEDIARRIHSRIDDYNREHPELPLHLSLGLATCKSKNETLEDAFKRADDLMYRYKLARRASARNQTAGALLAVLEEKDYITAGHAQRVEELCLKVGEKIGLSPRQMADLALLARVHDLGKVVVPGSILFKKGPLTEEELDLMRQHSEKGYRIALSSPDLAGVADLILKHHERWDGSGYPLGLKGEEIPVECRILTIVDAFDAMTSERPYRKPKSKEEAVAELERCAGSQFDPQLVDVFVSIVLPIST